MSHILKTTTLAEFFDWLNTRQDIVFSQYRRRGEAPEYMPRMVIFSQFKAYKEAKVQAGSQPERKEDGNIEKI